MVAAIFVALDHFQVVILRYIVSLPEPEVSVKQATLKLRGGPDEVDPILYSSNIFHCDD